MVLLHLRERKTECRIMNRSIHRRVALTSVDQVFSSASNFAVGVAVARISGPSGFGAYALAYAIWLFLVGIHRALVTEPMIILGARREGEAGSPVGGGLTSTVCIGLLATVVTAITGLIIYSAGERTLGNGVLGVAPWLTFLLIQDYWRWVGFMEGSPGKTLVNDVVFAGFQGLLYAALFLSGFDTPVAALAAWGAGAAVGALLGLKQFSIGRPLPGVRSHFGTTWMTSRWLLGDNLTHWISNQAYVVTIGAVLGAVGLGAFRAAQSLNGPLMILLQIGGSIGLPEASKGFKQDGLPGLRRVCHWVTTAGVVSASAFGLVIFIAAGPLMARIFGQEYGRYGALAILVAVSNIIGSFGLGTLLSLKVRGLTQSLFGVRLVCGAFSIATVILIAPHLGVAAAGWAVVLTMMANVLGLFYKSRTASDAAPAPSDPARHNLDGEPVVPGSPVQ